MSCSKANSFILQRLLDVSPESTIEDVMDSVPSLFSSKTLVELVEDDARDRQKSRAMLSTPSITAGAGHQRSTPRFFSLLQHISSPPNNRGTGEEETEKNVCGWF